MENNWCAAALMESTASKIQQLQKAFAELESHRAVTLNFQWKQLEEHLYGLQKSLKRRFIELEEQEKNFDARVAESKDMLEKRKAAVLAKEQASLERLQEKRDAAVSAILTCMQKKRPFPLDSFDRDTENHVENTSVDERADAEANSDFTKKRAKSVDVQVKSYPELVKLCREMNSEGLQKFISDNRRDLATLKEEVPIALSASADPGTLILETLKGFYGTEVPNFDTKKDSNLLGLRRTCIMLMECLSRLLKDQDVNYSHYEISEDARQGAKIMAENWKPKLENLDADASNGNSLEAHAFLLLLSTFGINSEFDQKILFKLIPMVSRRRQTAELCHSLGLTEKIPGIIDVLIKNGRQIDAANLAFAFELTDQFSPIPLLKSYLSEAKKAPKNGSTPPTASSQIDAHEKELTAIKAVMKCVEDHKLEEQFPLESLQKQVLEIEKAKAEKKRTAEVAKPQPKRPRATAAAHAPRVSPKAAAAEKNYHGSRMADKRYPQYGYEMLPPPRYAYPVPGEPHISPYMGTPSYTFSPSFFGNPYQYQTGYLH